MYQRTQADVGYMDICGDTKNSASIIVQSFNKQIETQGSKVNRQLESLRNSEDSSNSFCPNYINGIMYRSITH